MATPDGPLPDPDPAVLQNLRLTVSTNRPGHWGWHLHDGRDGSWFESMFEFDSEDEARRAGRWRLAELGQSVSRSTPPGEEGRRHVVVVSRQHEELYAVLKDLFAEADGVDVIRDRRKPLAPLPGRTADRRARGSGAMIEARGWSIARKSDRETA